MRISLKIKSSRKTPPTPTWPLPPKNLRVGKLQPKKAVITVLGAGCLGKELESGHSGGRKTMKFLTVKSKFFILFHFLQDPASAYTLMANNLVLNLLIKVKPLRLFLSCLNSFSLSSILPILFNSPSISDKYLTQLFWK